MSMLPYKDYLLPQNSKAISRIYEYRKSLSKYVEAYSKSNEERMSEARSEIIQEGPLIEKHLLHAGEDPERQYVNNTFYITQNLPALVEYQFKLNSLSGGETILQQVDDIFMRTIAKYEDNRLKAFINTINPLHWFKLLLNFVLVTPLQNLFNVKRQDRGKGIWLVLRGVIVMIVYLPPSIYALIQIFELLKGSV